jgi:hypothetical protein
MADVIKFPGGEGSESEEKITIVTALVGLLEEWIERCKRGEIVGIGLCVEYACGDTMWQYGPTDGASVGLMGASLLLHEEIKCDLMHDHVDEVSEGA